MFLNRPVFSGFFLLPLPIQIYSVSHRCQSNNSHAEGQGTVASGDFQLVIGQYNIANTTSSFIVGGGSSLTPKTIFDVRVDSNKSGSIMVPTNDSAPSNPLTGSMYFDYKGSRIWVYNGTAWKYATLS